MIILLDIDGVLVTTPIWRKVEILSDGFMKFDENAQFFLSILQVQTNASIVLTTTHRINYDEAKWKDIFNRRGLNFEIILKINNRNEISELPDRGTEIKEWVDDTGQDKNYVIIDDDTSINNLPDDIKKRWVFTKPLIGFDEIGLKKALHILGINY
jgi:hypothetical protein